MTQTPDPAGRYAPPRTDVADTAAPDALLNARPRSVVLAVALLLASLAISLITLLPFVDPPMAEEPVAMTALIWGITLVFTAIELWLLHAVWRRRNWARWLMVALVVFGTALSAQLVQEDLARAPGVAWLGIAALVLGAAAAGLLLAPPAWRWFTATAAR
jgi:hypothetical protein